jgi:hypothetical protein
MHPATRVLLDQLDVTPFLHGLRIHAYVDGLTEVSLDLIGVALDTDIREVTVPIQYMLPFPERTV